SASLFWSDVLLDVLAGALRGRDLLRAGISCHGFCLRSCLLLQRDAGLARPLARAGIGAGPLAAHGQAAAMPHPAVAAEVHQPLDRHRDLPAQVPFGHEAADLLPDALELAVREVLDLLRVGDPDGVADGARASAADAVDGREADLGVLPIGYVDSCDTCHNWFTSLNPGAACGADPCRSPA